MFLDGLLFQCLVERTWDAWLYRSQIWTVRLSLRDRALEARLDHFKGAKDSGRTGLPALSDALTLRQSAFLKKIRGHQLAREAIQELRTVLLSMSINGSFHLIECVLIQVPKVPT